MLKISYNTKEWCFIEKVFTTPARYAQGKDVFKTDLSHVLALVNRLLLLCNSIVYDLVGKDLEENLVAVHAIHNGFTTLHGDIHSLTHGKKVAYGTLTQLLLENRPKEELDKYITFYKELGLPTTLKEVKLDTVPYEDLLKIGRLATQDGETIHQMVVQYTAEDVANALIALDQYVTTRF